MFSSILWGIATLCTLIVTVRYYMPKLRIRIQNHENNSSTEKTDQNEVYLKENTNITTDTSVNWKYLFVLFSCICAACVCGYFVAGSVDSFISNLKMCIGFCVLCGIIVTDMELMIIPNAYVAILFAGRALTLLMEVVADPVNLAGRLIASVIGCIVCLLFLFFVSIITKGGLGEGDIKLFCGLGFLCGLYAAIYTLIFACTVCGIVSILLLVLRRKTMKDAVPMGPFILIGYIIMILLAVY